MTPLTRKRVKNPKKSAIFDAPCLWHLWSVLTIIYQILNWLYLLQIFIALINIKGVLKKFYSYFYDRHFIATLFWLSCIIAVQSFKFGEVRGAWFLLGYWNIDCFRNWKSLFFLPLFFQIIWYFFIMRYFILFEQTLVTTL